MFCREFCNKFRQQTKADRIHKEIPMKLFDCTLRDGGNVLGQGFPADLTTMMIEGLVRNGILDIEYGNANGLGAREDLQKIAPLTDDEYLALAAPHADRCRLGMFMLAACANEDRVARAADAGLHFLRVGANAGDGARAVRAVELVKSQKLCACYSLMKAYVLSPDALADEARMLEDSGVDCITIMDSAGTMMPEDVARYVTCMVDKVSIPVGFHGHNNLGLSVQNAITAYRHGAEVIDCGLMGMARSAGNLATEIAMFVFDRLGVKTGDLYGMLHFIEDELVPAMKQHNYVPSVSPLDLTFGYAGCHSSLTKTLSEVAREKNVDLFKLVVAISAQDRKAPGRDLILNTATQLAG